MMTTFDRRLSHALDSINAALDSLICLWITSYRMHGPARGEIVHLIEHTHGYINGSRQILEAVLLSESDEAAMDSNPVAHVAFARITHDILAGLMVPVDQHPRNERHHIPHGPLLTPEAKRRYEAERKRRYRLRKGSGA